MSWTLYRLVFRLRSPLHVGWGKIGNVQRTRPYLTGRSFWGGLTMRLTRLRHGPAGPVSDSAAYRAVGDELNRTLAWTYFYPALRDGADVRVYWPWAAAGDFAPRFLGSYGSTALAYPHQAASEATLHEVEFISPHTLEQETQPVYLAGYVFAHDDAADDWRAACRLLQFGGERSYGWGDVALETLELQSPAALFDNAATFDGDGPRPRLNVPAGGRLLAHTHPDGARLAGDVEPLVGREWRSGNTTNRHSGAHVEYSGIFLSPGSTALSATRIVVEPFGLWRADG